METHGRVEPWPGRPEPSLLLRTPLTSRAPGQSPPLLVSVSQLYQEGLDAELRKRALSVDRAPCSLLAGWGVGPGHVVLSPPPPAGRAARAERGHSPGNLPSSSALAAHRQPQGGARGSQRPLASARARRRGAPGCGAHGAASRPRGARSSATTAARSVASRAAPIVCAALCRRPLGPRCTVPPGLPGSGRVGGDSRGPAPPAAGVRGGRRRASSGARSWGGGRRAGLPPAGGGGWTLPGPPGLASTIACTRGLWGPRTARASEPRLTAAHRGPRARRVSRVSRPAACFMPRAPAGTSCRPKPKRVRAVGHWAGLGWRPEDTGVSEYTALSCPGPHV